MEMDPEVMKFYDSRPHGTLEAAEAIFNKYLAYMSQFPDRGGYAVYHNDTKEFVGLGVLIHLELNPLETKHEVGYRLPVKQWGKGYATEICQALLKYGFQTLGLSVIMGTTHLASQRVLEKSGLIKVGTSPHYGGSVLFKVEKNNEKS